MENLIKSTFIYQNDFKVYLRKELNRRSEKNPNYSLRSFAKSLDIDPSLLSKLISGKRKISDKQIEKIGTLLGLSLRELNSFMSPKNLEENEKQAYRLSFDQFDIICEWQHYAILEMMTLNEFKPETSWIAKVLRMKESEVFDYIERLKRVGLIVLDEDGNWEDTSAGKSTHVLDKNFTSYAHKQSQEKVLNMAIDSLNTTPIEKRDQSSVMVTTTSKKISQAKDMITSFRRSLTHFLEDTDERTAVYQMSISLFPLIDIESTNHKELK